jgi:hypothetical protein
MFRVQLTALSKRQALRVVSAPYLRAPLSSRFFSSPAETKADEGVDPTSKLSKRAKRALDQRGFVLRLYRGIRRAHSKLPPQMRDLGNEYVRNEFQLHKDAQPEHLRGFFQQWLDYLTHLAEAPDLGAPGENLDDTKLDNLSTEQAEQLAALHGEITSLYADQDPNEASDAGPAASGN